MTKFYSDNEENMAAYSGTDLSNEPHEKKNRVNIYQPIAPPNSQHLGMV